MTILEAIKEVLKNENKALTSKEIYQRIIKSNFYTFGAKDPKSLVNGIIRRHSIGIDFPTANPVKHFRVHSKEGSTTRYVLKDSTEESKIRYQNTTTTHDLLPEEKIQTAYKEHKNAIKQALLDIILQSDPAFFEALVLDLLLNMGYGGSDPKAGMLSGKSHDGGIDGIIKEDKLGLGKIYIQAKRHNSSNTIGRPLLQTFVGAMENIPKGVFITTSSFTKHAIEYVEKQQKSIVLIDGNELTDLMVTYQVGVSEVKSFATYRVDSDYFSEYI